MEAEARGNVAHPHGVGHGRCGVDHVVIRVTHVPAEVLMLDLSLDCLCRQSTSETARARETVRSCRNRFVSQIHMYSLVFTFDLCV